jgi:hypothetical protein
MFLILSPARWPKLWLLPLPLLFMHGCATIFTGTSDTLKFDANVPGVRLTMDGRYQGELPLTLDVSRNFMNGEQFKVKFEKAGYETQEFQLKRQFNTIAVLDVTSIPTSGGIDLLTGSLMRFSPTDYHVHMTRKGENSSGLEFQRSAYLYQYALVNYDWLRRDIAAGGGDYLTSLAMALTGKRAGDALVVTDRTLHHAPQLLAAKSAHDFVHRFNVMLAGDAQLRAWRL